jgi:PIN domain nuclease of toxin-antitoxin system
VILLDTHIWVWWVHRDEHLPARLRTFIERHESATLGVSAISCWEVAKLVERGRLRLPMPTGNWLHAALAYPGVRLLDLTPDISVQSCNLPGHFHADPADQIIVATARHHRVGLVTLDARIRGYPQVQIAGHD